MKRRDFIKATAAGVVGCCAAPLEVFAKLDVTSSKHIPGIITCMPDLSTYPGSRITSLENETYDKEKLLKEYTEYEESKRILYASYFGEDLADTMIKEMREEYEALIPEIPYIGEDNGFLRFLIPAARALAHYRVLKNYGVLLEEFFRMSIESYENYLYSTPEWLRLLRGRVYCSKFNSKMARFGLNRSQMSPYPEDYVYEFVQGDGEEFDWGIDFTQCTAVIFLIRQGAEELFPYYCAHDFITSKALNTGYTRTRTLSSGDEVCNMRWKWDREVEVPYPY